jgi:hypothetical protein
VSGLYARVLGEVGRGELWLGFVMNLPVYFDLGC